jgi:hypothetical protein
MDKPLKFSFEPEINSTETDSSPFSTIKKAREEYKVPELLEKLKQQFEQKLLECQNCQDPWEFMTTVTYNKDIYKGTMFDLVRLAYNGDARFKSLTKNTQVNLGEYINTFGKFYELLKILYESSRLKDPNIENKFYAISGNFKTWRLESIKKYFDKFEDLDYTKKENFEKLYNQLSESRDPMFRDRASSTMGSLYFQKKGYAKMFQELVNETYQGEELESKSRIVDQIALVSNYFDTYNVVNKTDEDGMAIYYLFDERHPFEEKAKSLPDWLKIPALELYEKFKKSEEEARILYESEKKK